MTPNRNQILLWGLIMIMGLLLIMINFPKYQVGAHYDDAAYITLARSLLQNKGYGLINFPDEPRAWNYPFGFPLLLAPIAALLSSPFSPNRIEIYKLVSVIATLTNGGLIFWGWGLLTRKLSNWWALGVTALYLTSPVTLDLSGRVMSEPVFLTFYLLAMLLAEKIRQRHANPNQNWQAVILPLIHGAILAFLLSIRTIGFVLVFSIFLYLFLTLRKKYLGQFILTLSGSVVFILLVVGLTQVNVKDLLPTEYITDKQAALLVGLAAPLTQQSDSILAINPQEERPTSAEQVSQSLGLKGLIQDYVIEGLQFHFSRSVRGGVFPFGGSDGERAFAQRIGLADLPLWIGYLISATIIFGYFRWFRREKVTIFNLSSVIYFFSLLAWVWSAPRFLNPIQPQLFTALILGVEGLLIIAVWLLSMIERSVSSDKRKTSIPELTKWGVIAFTAVMLATSLYKSLKITDSRLHVGDLADRTRWISQNTSQEAVVLSEYPVIDYIYSDRYAIPYPYKTSSAGPGKEITQAPAEDDFAEYIATQQVNYILVAPRLVWMKNTYQPRYTPEMETMVPLLEKLVSQGLLEQVDLEPESKILVFRVNRILKQ